MSEKIDPRMLQRRWFHAHEEDTATESVYRPAGYALPRARGRTGFELRADQTAQSIGIGRADAPEHTGASWKIDEPPGAATPALEIRLDTGETQVLPIVSVGPDRLVVRKTN